MAKLAVAYPQQQRAMSRADIALRAETYFEALAQDLSGPEWVFAVREAIRTGEFFPSASELLDLGLEERRRNRVEPARPPEISRAEAAEIASAWIPRLKQAVASAPALPRPQRPVLLLPSTSSETVATDERLELLREQLRQIQPEPAA